jgi:glycosyltransferase involved in cell wall biosynthesis
MLIESISLLTNEIKNKIQVILIGDGPEKENLASQIIKLNLSETILLHPSIESASMYMKAFDLFVLSSRVEGFPFVLLEALQAELPIIATDVGGNKEALGDAGILIPRENPTAISQAIIKILTDEGLKTSLINNSKTRSQMFTEEKMFSEVEKVYKSLDIRFGCGV